MAKGMTENAKKLSLSLVLTVFTGLLGDLAQASDYYELTDSNGSRRLYPYSHVSEDLLYEPASEELAALSVRYKKESKSMGELSGVILVVACVTAYFSPPVAVGALVGSLFFTAQSSHYDHLSRKSLDQAIRMHEAAVHDLDNL